jgi:hypothetical protein
MEAIPKEVIDMAEDFFARLSPAKQKNMLKEYYKEQVFISSTISYWIENLKDKNTTRIIESLYLVICRSYEYYGLKLPVIPMETCETTYQQYLKKVNIHDKNGLMALAIMQEGLKDICQENLANYIILKLSGSEGNLVDYTSLTDMGTTQHIAMILLLLLNNETKKQLRNEIN